jgi:hypothetical protein
MLDDPTQGEDIDASNGSLAVPGLAADDLLLVRVLVTMDWLRFKNQTKTEVWGGGREC